MRGANRTKVKIDAKGDLKRHVFGSKNDPLQRNDAKRDLKSYVFGSKNKKRSLAEKPLLPPRLLHEVVLQSSQTAATQHLAGRLGIAH